MKFSTKSLQIAPVLVAGLCCLELARAQGPMTCSATAAAVQQRAEGATEKAGDFVVTCSGGTPTPAGLPVPTANIQVFVNTNVASRLLADGWSEALLLIDDPFGASQRICGTVGDVIAGPRICTITGTGTGAGVYDGSPGRPNVFQGQQAGVNSIIWTGVPIDPPGFGFRIVRILNLRANAAALAQPLGQPPGGVTETLTSTGEGRLPLGANNAQQLVGIVLHGISASVEMPTQCASEASTLSSVAGKRVSQTTVHINEGFGSAFRVRTIAAFIDDNTSPDPADQKIPGAFYNTESGFFNSSFGEFAGRGNLGRAGLANQGTRLFVRIEGVPRRVALYSPVVIVIPAGFGGGLGVARRVDAESGGAGPFAPTAGNANGLASIPNADGIAIAFYEVLSTNTAAIDQVDIPVFAVSPGNSGVPGMAGASVTAGFAPVSKVTSASLTDSIPRFVGPSTVSVPLTPQACQP